METNDIIGVLKRKKNKWQMMRDITDSMQSTDTRFDVVESDFG